MHRHRYAYAHADAYLDCVHMDSRPKAGNPCARNPQSTHIHIHDTHTFARAGVSMCRVKMLSVFRYSHREIKLLVKKTSCQCCFKIN